jgi:hypothetical protein
MDTQLSSERVLDRLGHEELKLKQLGMVNQAAGIRTAIVAVLKMIHEGEQSPSPIDESD